MSLPFVESVGLGGSDDEERVVVMALIHAMPASTAPSATSRATSR
jgi:hypothetical protein